MPSPKYSPIRFVGGLRGTPVGLLLYVGAPLKGSKASTAALTWNPLDHVLPPLVLYAASTLRGKSCPGCLWLVPLVYQATMRSPNLSIAAAGKRLKLFPGPAACVRLVQVAPKSRELA